MSDEDEKEEEEEEEEEESGKGKKKLYFIIAGIIILLLVLGAAYYFFFYKKPEAKKDSKNPAQTLSTTPIAKDVANKPIYTDLDDFLVNLNRGDGQASYLKVGVTLMIPNSTVAKSIQDKLPQIKDAFQIYLRELYPEDLQGSAGVYRLKQDLLLRINTILYPDKITDILFRSILVQ